MDLRQFGYSPDAEAQFVSEVNNFHFVLYGGGNAQFAVSTAKGCVS